MKFLLVIHLCSFLTQTCPNMMHPRETFDTWSDCAIAGYETSAEIFSGIDKNVANKQKLAIRFECKELDKT